MLNQCIIMGRLTANPELRTTGNGISVCSFTVACDRDRTADGGQKCDFIDCVAWRKTGEFVNKYFIKGKPILVAGRLQQRDWTDRSGNKRRSFEILVENVEFCGGEKVQNGAAPAQGYGPAPTPAQSAPPVFDEMPDVGDDLPWNDDKFSDISGLPV